MTQTAPPDRSALGRLGRLLARRRLAVLISGAVALITAGVVGAPVIGELSLARFDAPGSESDRVGTVLAEEFSVGSPDVALLVTVKDGTVDDPAAVEAGRRLTAELTGFDGVADVRSYWDEASPTLRSEDATQAVLLARLPGDANEVRRSVLPELVPEFTRDSEVVSVAVGGGEELFRQASAYSTQDFLRAEMIIFPTVFVLLVVVLRSFALAVVPLLIGLFTIVGSLAFFRVITLFTELSTFALNITLVMGLALGVDYCLFLIYRFREELRAGHRTPEAVERTMRSAGRTVLFSGATVAVSLAVLFVLPFDFLRSFAYAGIAVVTAGVVGALVLLPAALALFGPRAAGRPPRHGTGGFWHGTARRVMGRPLLYGGGVLALLLVLGSPVLDLRFGLPDERILPEQAPARQVSAELRENFTAEEGDAVQVVVELPAAHPGIGAYAADLSRIDGVVQVDSAAGSYVDGAALPGAAAGAERFTGQERTWLSVVPGVERLEQDPFGLVEEVRAVPAPAEVMVGGYPAELLDYRDVVIERVPLMLGLMFVTTLVLLFLLTGSVLLPVKATVLNVLSLSVMFGALVWGFQEGNLSGLLPFTPSGSLETSIPLLMFCIAYGLSMDYEVFMLARIKEEYERSGDNTAAVAAGLQRSGPLVSAAGAILALSFAAYATSGVVFLQMLGVGLALAILVDATLIRAVLVPALMRLAGGANWWAPGPLRRLHARIGLSESGPAGPLTSPAPQTPAPAPAPPPR
ncbi:MMPL family transporter [Marinactinospora thermotolerans]|uniref:MMPL family transporter n=1 Tax=Marinactinospora thermotolerans TaxID=531310 RepID=UPI003D907D19